MCDTMIEFWERLTPPSPSLYYITKRPDNDNLFSLVATNASYPSRVTLLCRKKEEKKKRWPRNAKPPS